MHKIVSEHFSPFGEVVSLKVLNSSAHDNRLILITMNSPQAAASAINGLELLSFGERSLIITVPSGRS